MLAIQHDWEQLLFKHASRSYHPRNPSIAGYEIEPDFSRARFWYSDGETMIFERLPEGDPNYPGYRLMEEA